MTIRDRIEILFRDSKTVAILAVLILILVTLLDSWIPPLGIPLGLLVVWAFRVLQGGTWAKLGLSRPRNWGRCILTGLGIAIALQLFGTLILGPFLNWLTGEVTDLSRFDSVRGNYAALALYLTVAWTTAGFGEEIIWRGYVLNRLGLLGGGGKPA